MTSAACLDIMQTIDGILAARMETAFSDQQYDLYYPPGIECHWWTLARNRLLAAILRREISSARSLLEVGCGRGLVVKDLRERGFNVRGVELAGVAPLTEVEQLVDAATDVFDLPEASRRCVTGILLLDVVEHLPEVNTFLERLDASFPNLALVVLTVPAREELWSNYDLTVGHFRRYTLERLENIALDLGWSVRQTGYFFRLSYLPMRLMSLFGMKRNTRFDPPGKLMQPLHRLVSLLCRVEQVLLPQRIRGSSAYAVYQPARRTL